MPSLICLCRLPGLFSFQFESREKHSRIKTARTYSLAQTMLSPALSDLADLCQILSLALALWLARTALKKSKVDETFQKESLSTKVSKVFRDLPSRRRPCEVFKSYV